MQPPSVVGKLNLIHLFMDVKLKQGLSYPWRRSYSAAETLMPLHPNSFLIVIPPFSMESLPSCILQAFRGPIVYHSQLWNFRHCKGFCLAVNRGARRASRPFRVNMVLNHNVLVLVQSTSFAMFRGRQKRRLDR
jgi:hypothetical protein